MIPTAGFSLHDFFATAQFAFDIYTHLQLTHQAPIFFDEFKKHVYDFGLGLQNLHSILQEHERHLFNTGAGSGHGWPTSDNKVQRTLSEVVGDFKALEEATEKFLKTYKFLVQGRKGGGWAWKKVKFYADSPAMYTEMESLKMEYMFHTAKVNIVIEPLKL